jgi:hypothetical protein
MQNDFRRATTEQIELRSRINMGSGARRLLNTNLLLLGLAVIFATTGQAADYSQEALNRANAFLSSRERGAEVLSYVHFGASYRGHVYLRTRGANDGEGAFALVYRFKWEDDGVTDVAFLCNNNGYVYRVRIDSTNAQASPPFFWANLSIAVLGHGLIELYKDRLSENDQRQLHALVRDADAKGLLELSLKLEQLLP